jgi:hypothetical protein
VETERLHPADKPNWFLVNCEHCGIEFAVPPYRIKRGKPLYHNPSCRTKAENAKRAGKYKITNTENMGKGKRGPNKNPSKPREDKSILPDGTQRCIKCGEKFPATEEYFHKRVDKGVKKLKHTCKECVNKMVMDRYIENSEEINEKCREKYAQNPESVLAKQKQYYHNGGGKEVSREYRIKNWDKISVRANGYRERNRQKIRDGMRSYYSERGGKEKRKEYVENNKDRIRQANTEYYRKLYKTEDGRKWITLKRHIRRARKENLPATLTIDDWNDSLSFFDSSCAYCGKVDDPLHQDHVIPVSKGGYYTRGNIIPACKPCNCSKVDKDMEEWYRKQPFFSEVRLRKIHRWTGFNPKTKTQQLSIF